MRTFKVHLNKTNGEKYLCAASFYQMPISKSVDLATFLSLPAADRCFRCSSMIKKATIPHVFKKGDAVKFRCASGTIRTGTIIRIDDVTATIDIGYYLKSAKVRNLRGINTPTENVPGFHD